MPREVSVFLSCTEILVVGAYSASMSKFSLAVAVAESSRKYVST